MLASVHARTDFRQLHYGISIRMFHDPSHCHTFLVVHAQFLLSNRYFGYCLSKRILIQERGTPTATFCWRQTLHSIGLWPLSQTTGTLSFLWWTPQLWPDTTICISSFCRHRTLFLCETSFFGLLSENLKRKKKNGFYIIGIMHRKIINNNFEYWKFRLNI